MKFSWKQTSFRNNGTPNDIYAEHTLHVDDVGACNMVIGNYSYAICDDIDGLNIISYSGNKGNRELLENWQLEAIEGRSMFKKWSIKTDIALIKYDIINDYIKNEVK